jgi:serine/threonine-protein kinase HipA
VRSVVSRGAADAPGAVDALEALVADRRVGRLARSDVEEDTFLFTYADRVTAADAVSLTMPVVRDPYDSMSIVHPVFEMNLPEGSLLEQLRLRFSKTTPNLDSLTLLGIVGRAQLGRLRYASAGSSPVAVPEQSIEELLSYEGAHDLFHDLLERYAIHSGISGVQPKVLVRGARSPRRSLAHFTDRGATHIVKSFDPREYPELAANEHYCMRAAAHAGIRTAKVELSQNRRVLVVERFDRKADGSYLGLEDFCVLSGLRAHGRYEGSYELLAKRIRDFVSPAHQREALEELFSILALSCAVENGDAHLKNFAVVYDDAEQAVRLAPAYDIVSTTPYQPKDVLALTLLGSKAFPDRKQLVKFGQLACGLSPAKSRERIDRAVAGALASIEELSRAAKADRRFAPMAKRLQQSFERGAARLSG